MRKSFRTYRKFHTMPEVPRGRSRAILEQDLILGPRPQDDATSSHQPLEKPDDADKEPSSSERHRLL